MPIDPAGSSQGEARWEEHANPWLANLELTEEEADTVVAAVAYAMDLPEPERSEFFAYAFNQGVSSRRPSTKRRRIVFEFEDQMVTRPPMRTDIQRPSSSALEYDMSGRHISEKSG